MACKYCNGTGKIKQPKDIEQFDRLVDIEMDKGYHVNYEMAEKKVYDKMGYTLVDCPHCNIALAENKPDD